MESGPNNTEGFNQKQSRGGRGQKRFRRGGYRGNRGSYNYNKNYYNNKKKNNIAVEIPDNQPQQQEVQLNQQNQNNFLNNQNQINNTFANNQINQINIQNNMYYQMMQARMMSNYQAEMFRMNYYTNMEHLTSDLYSKDVFVPMTDSSIVDVLENYFSEKNLNKDLNLRKNMDEETGNVPIEFILNLKKIQSMKLTAEKIDELIKKIGSDKIQVVHVENNMFLRPKNYENIKNNLKTIEEIEQNYEPKNKNNNQQQPNMNIGMQPMYFYPMTPMMYYNPMMMAQQQNMNNQTMMQNQNQNINENKEQDIQFI
jgi:hypothetical protein